MDRLDYEKRIDNLLDLALNKLSGKEFDKLLERVKEMIENCT